MSLECVALPYFTYVIEGFIMPNVVRFLEAAKSRQMQASGTPLSTWSLREAVFASGAAGGI